MEKQELKKLDELLDKFDEEECEQHKKPHCSCSNCPYSVEGLYNTECAISIVQTKVFELLKTKSKDKEKTQMSKNEELKELARPLVEYIKKNYHPHTTIIIDVQHAEVLEGVAVANFLNDESEK